MRGTTYVLTGRQRFDRSSYRPEVVHGSKNRIVAATGSRTDNHEIINTKAIISVAWQISGSKRGSYIIRLAVTPYDLICCERGTDRKGWTISGRNYPREGN